MVPLTVKHTDTGRGTPARRTWISELRALLAVAKREWVIFVRYPSWVMAFFIWPVLFPLGYIFSARALGGPDGAGLAAFRRLTGTEDYVGFIVVGSTLWMWLNMTLWDMGFLLRMEQMWGTLESNWLAPMSRITFVLGAASTKMLTGIMCLVVTVIEFRLIFGVNLVGANLPLVLLVLGLTLPAVYGLGLAFAALVLYFKEANAMVFIVRGLFMLLCGITYPLAVSPRWMQALGSLLPLTYAIRSMRTVALAGATFADIQHDVGRLAVFAVLMPLLGYLAFRLAERWARSTGNLGQY